MPFSICCFRNEWWFRNNLDIIAIYKSKTAKSRSNPAWLSPMAARCFI